MTDSRSQPTNPDVRQEIRKVPVLVPDANSASSKRIEWLSIEVDGDLAKILDSCAIPPEDAADKADAWDAVAAKNAKIASLTARVEELEAALRSHNVNLIVCLDMLREACSPFVPSSGRDNEWLGRRDRVVTNADACLAALSQSSGGAER